VVDVHGTQVRRKTASRNGIRPVVLPEDAGAAPLKAVKIAGSVLANTALLTALLYYFGFLYTQVYFAHFLVHYTVLGQTLEEILARGADGLFVPLGVLAAGVLVALCAVQFLRLRLSERVWARILRVCVPLAALVGLGLVVMAVFVALDPESYRLYAGVPGVGFAVGVLLLVFAWRRVAAHERISGTVVAEWVITFVLVSIGLFWAVGDYSGAVGVRRAYESELRVPDLPNVLVYSEKSLNLPAGAVREVVCREPEAAYRYRYAGLKLLLQSGGQYVFVPADWTAESGTSLVLPRTDSVRLEFTPPSATAGDTC
jgi:hypothetical protein